MREQAVLHILLSVGVGGLVKLVETLARTQNRGGMKAHIFAIRAGGERMSVLSKDIMILDGGLQHTWSGVLSRFPGWVRTFRKYPVLHMHTFHPAVALAALVSGRPVVYTIHGGKGINGVLTAKGYIMNALLLVFLRYGVVFVVANSYWTMAQARRLFRLRDARSSVIHNGVALSSVESSKSDVLTLELAKFSSARFVVGTCSRFTAVKRVDILVEAFADFHQICPDSLLLLVGDGPERGRIEDQVQKLNLSGKVVLPGYMENVTDWQRKFDIAVFPAVNEPFGLVAVESLMLGIPVIAFTNGGGIVEVIRELNPRNVVASIDELVARLKHYYKEGVDLAERERAKQFAVRFSAESMESEYKKLYRAGVAGK